MANDNLKGLYNTLVHTGYNPPAYDQFVQDMKDEKNLRGAWNTLRREGYTPPKFETFKADMGWTGTQKAGTSKQTGSGRGQVAQAARGAGGGSVMNAIRFM